MMNDNDLPIDPEVMIRKAYEVLRIFAQVIAERDGKPWNDPEDPIIFRVDDGTFRATRLSRLVAPGYGTERGH